MKARLVTCSVVLALLLALILSTGVSADYGSTNLALGKAIAPLTGTVQGTPENVTDGNDISVWYSYQGGSYNTCSFTLDLGAEYTIGRYYLWPAQTHGYQIETSTNGIDWTTRHQYDWEGSIIEGVYITDPVWIPVDGTYAARYIRYSGHVNWNAYIGVNEFAVYDWDAGPTPTATAVATPTAVPTATATPVPTVAPDPPAPPEVPEPGTLMLLAGGLAGLGGFTAFRNRFRR